MENNLYKIPDDIKKMMEAFGELESSEIWEAIDWAFSKIISDEKEFSYLLILAEAAARYIESSNKDIWYDKYWSSHAEVGRLKQELQSLSNAVTSNNLTYGKGGTISQCASEEENCSVSGSLPEASIQHHDAGAGANPVPSRSTTSSDTMLEDIRMLREAITVLIGNTGQDEHNAWKRRVGDAKKALKTTAKYEKE